MALFPNLMVFEVLTFAFAPSAVALLKLPDVTSALNPNAKLLFPDELNNNALYPIATFALPVVLFCNA